MRGFVPPLSHMHSWPPICRRFIRSVTVTAHSHSDPTLYMIIRTIQSLALTLSHFKQTFSRSLFWQNRTNWSFQSEISHITTKRRKLSVCHWTCTSKVRLDKLIVLQLIAQFLDFYGADKFISVFKKDLARWCPEPNGSSPHAYILYFKVQFQYQYRRYAINE